MKLSEWAERQGIHYQTAWKWFKEGNLPVAASQTPTGTILVQERELDLKRELEHSVRAELGDVERASRAFRQRAAGLNLADVAYAIVESPVGDLLAASTEQGLVRLAYRRDDNFDRLLRELVESISPRVLELPDRFDCTRRELDEYFEGKRRQFALDIDWRLVHGFRRQVLEATAEIEYGKVATYAEVAARAGSGNAYRAAGNALGANPIPIVIPCHRVVKSGGGMGGYGGGIETKEYLLRLEGAI